MKNKRKLFLVLTLAVVFLCCRRDPAAAAENAQPEQSVSTGAALTEWLELHKDTGGTVKLGADVVWDGAYTFCSSGINMSAVLVDTGQYTITVTGEIELLSDNRLTFSGQPDGKSIFYVAEKGMLSMLGVAVEGGQCALWQEEGAGLEVTGCHISGSVHYADTPFVMYSNPVCAVVEKGQTVNDVLPAQVYCRVNYQGKLISNELVPVSWNLEGTEKQQEERRRFLLQGSYTGAASAEPAFCVAVYNDYPLTFTDVKASESNGSYLFQGGFTVPKDALPITVRWEYSFDGESWSMYEEHSVTSEKSAAFYIAIKSEQRDPATQPDIYIRLKGNGNGTEYLSNVLRYAADSLEFMEDMGGSRGGGTAIVNPPDAPQINTGITDSQKEEPDRTVPLNPVQPAPNGTENTAGDTRLNGNRDAGDAGTALVSPKTGEEDKSPVPVTGCILPVIAGAVCFGVHSRSGTNRYPL